MNSKLPNWTKLAQILDSVSKNEPTVGLYLKYFADLGTFSPVLGRIHLAFMGASLKQVCNTMFFFFSLKLPF